MKKYPLNSFFAGIGGFDIGFERHGFKTQFLCEINPFCQDVLSVHWPKVKLASDICSLKPEDIPEAAVWCGGFPCQDISVARGASKRLGLKGNRSGLFYDYAKLVETCSPEVVIIENVQGLFTSNGGRDFGVVLQTMTQLGYAVAWRLLNSRYFGVPQSRSRVYICCWKNSLSKSTAVMFDTEGAAEPENERKGFITESNPINSYPKVPIVGYCLAATSGRHTGTDWSRSYVVCEDGVRRLTPLESERLQGFPDLWTLPSKTSYESDEIDTLRYTAIGNAVSIPIIEWLAGRVYSNLSQQTHELTKDEIKQYVPEMKNSQWSKDDLQGIDFLDETISYKWPKGGVAIGNSFIGASIHPTPKEIIPSSLYEIVEKGQVDRHYYLTPNAAEGILRRVERQGRTLFAPLRKALEIEKNKK